MQIVVPMVGLGQRFRNAGYSTPKPLLEVDGVPMIVRVVRDLPETRTTVFVINHQHVLEYQIDKLLLQQFPNAELVIAEQLTDGQACSVQLAIPALNPKEDVLVVACDNSHLYDEPKWNQLISDPAVDAVIWTYRNEPRVLIEPKWYGWVEADENGIVKRVSVKKPISDTPLSDHVVSGSFWFRSAELLNQGISDLVRSNERVNNEFYLDAVPGRIMDRGGCVRVFEVDKYIGWGTPQDYEDYHRWSRYIQSSGQPVGI
jgi:NDP-sugar pyrophosphorylase family protein